MIEESKIKKFLVIGTSPSVIKRGIKYSIIVGTVLTLINHGGSLLERELDKIKLLRIGLTYIVSTLSSVQAILVDD
jgi:hypothetical protein